MTDIEIARQYKMQPIEKIAKKIGLKNKDLIKYGDYKAKIKINAEDLKDRNSNLILVTAINPTSAGNGKTTVAIGLADAMRKLKQNVCLALREPSLGPVFGIKGGATGGGYSQIVPMEDINLHFNGDFHAITSANNLLCSLIDNHIFQGNELNLDTKNIYFNRCLDVNDRALREIVIANTKNEKSRKEKFNITAASEIMAIMCLAKDLADLKERLGNILIGLNTKGKPVYAKELQAQDAMAILLKDALKPNLVQTLGGTPAIVHLGPFANIAHGCNSLVATNLAMKLSDYCVTEAGFGADLGAEKFIDIKCRIGNLKPKCIVLVATVRALKLHGGAKNNDLASEDLNALVSGLSNLEAHINTIKNVYNLPLVVTLNKFVTDTEAEVAAVKNFVLSLGCEFAENNVWAEGGNGAITLAEKVIELCKKEDKTFNFAYDLSGSIENKIEQIATKIYGASGVEFSKEAKESIKIINEMGYSNYPIVVAKTQYSLSDNPALIGAPKNFVIHVRNLELKTGAKFIVALLGDMLLMPGLSKKPAAVNMKIDSNEIIEGLF